MKRVFNNAGKGILTRLSAKTTYKIWVTASTSNKEGERSSLTTVETCEYFLVQIKGGFLYLFNLEVISLLFYCFQFLSDADECESSPCKYDGKCHLYDDSYKCECEGDWQGPSCESKFLLNLMDELKVTPLKEVIGNLRTTTTALLTTTRSELQCTAQARLVNFVVVVSSTTPNIVESRRPTIHKLRQV